MFLFRGSSKRSLIPSGLVWLAFVRREDSLVLLLIRQRNGILAISFKPLVYLVKVDYPTLAWLCTRNLPACEFLIDGRKGNVCVLGNLLWRDRTVSVLSLLNWSVLKVQQ